MRVPARVIADDTLIEQIERDHSLEQLVNVTTLPRRVGRVIGMPDMHEGYGFPVGGVAATLAPDGVISPGGIGFDINCGVRLLASDAPARAGGRALEALVHELSRSVPDRLRPPRPPRALGGRARPRARRGLPLRWCASSARHRGRPRAHRVGRVPRRRRRRRRSPSAPSSAGRISSARSAAATTSSRCRWSTPSSTRARPRALGLFLGQLTVLIHTGSRGLGHQVCTDYVRQMDASLARHRIDAARSPARLRAALARPRDRTTSPRCAPRRTSRGRTARCSRTACARCSQRVLSGLGDPSLRDRLRRRPQHREARAHRRPPALRAPQGRDARLRPAATPSFPERYRDVGQPVFIPGQHGHLLVRARGHRGVGRSSRFASCCHGAGRAMSRHAAKQQVEGRQLRAASSRRRGIVVRCAVERGARRGGAARLQGRRARGRRRRARRHREEGRAAAPVGGAQGLRRRCSWKTPTSRRSSPRSRTCWS